MTNRAYSLFVILVGLFGCTTIASAQTLSTATAATTNAETSLVTIRPSVDFKKAMGQTVSLTVNGRLQVDGFVFDRYSVFDEQGEMWVSGPGTSQTIDLGHLPTGVYYLHLSSKDGEVVSKVLKGK